MGDLLTGEALADLAASLVAIPSVNPALAPEEGGSEAAVAEFARRWCADRGLDARLEEVAPGRPNLVVSTGRRTGGPTLVLCAHLDTVGTAGMAEPFRPAVSAGRLYGRGAYDMKGSVAAVLAALATLADAELPGEVVGALVVDEEHASLGAQHFVAHHRADGCILTEPSEDALVLAHKGFAWFEIAIPGRAAHGSRHDLGESAIENAAPLVEALRRHDREVLRRRRHPLVGAASQHVAGIAGGGGWSTYAERCVLRLERRMLPDEDLEAVRAEVARLVARHAPGATVEMVLARPPLLCDRSSPIARATREALREVTGGEPREAGVGYWMDAALFAAAGIPTVDFGPSGAGAHETVEWVEIASLVTTARVLVGAARRFLAA